jgi:hypothetical protein
MQLNRTTKQESAAEEVFDEVEVSAVAEVDAPEPAPVARARVGRPPKHGVAMTASERRRAWRDSNSVVSLEIPGDLAERIRVLRDARGLSTRAVLESLLQSAGA